MIDETKLQRLKAEADAAWEAADAAAGDADAAWAVADAARAAWERAARVAEGEK